MRMRTLTMKEEKRLEIIQRVFRGELTMGKASLVLGVGERQCYRIKARVKQQGVKGVVHGNRGRACKRKVKEKEVQRIVELAKGKYRGFNDHHLTEKLREQEEIELSREKIRQVLRFHGILSPRKKRTAKHRRRRERKEAEGMMLQVDGSPHDWLEGRGPSLCLVGAIDVRSPELSLSQPRALGLTSVCSLKSLRNKGCVSQSTPTVILSFGLTENRPSKSN